MHTCEGVLPILVGCNAREGLTSRVGWGLGDIRVPRDGHPLVIAAGSSHVTVACYHRMRSVVLKAKSRICCSGSIVVVVALLVNA